MKIPVYVTREPRNGNGVWYVSAWAVFLVQALVWINIVVWSLYGLWQFGVWVVS